MKWKVNRKNKASGDDYSVEIKEELMNNSIVLSFALCIIIIGIFSCFYKANDALLIGIALSSLLLTLIQCFSNGNTMLNILPIFTMLVFGFFQGSIKKIPGLNVLLYDNIRNLIIFISFSLTFFTQAYKNIKFKHDLKKQLIDFNSDKNKLINNQLSVIKNVDDRVANLKGILKKSNINDHEFESNLVELKKYVDAESFVSNVKSSLIIKGSEEQKSSFDIEEVEESIILNCKMGRARKINASDLDDDEYIEDKE